MTAAMLVLEPIFEADLQPEQYAYRPGTQCVGRCCQVEQLLRSRHREVIDADLSGYFDSIPHAELMKSVARRISDRQRSATDQDVAGGTGGRDGRERRNDRTTRNKDRGRGTPKGRPISPLLSNLYMRRFIRGGRLGTRETFSSQIVNYADDFVICCRRNADEAMDAMRSIMWKLKLTVNEEKTHVCRLPDESFDFLGYTFGRNYDCRTGESYLGPRPSRKKVDRLCSAINELTTRRKAWRDVDWS